jgi:hypothetical protein
LLKQKSTQRLHARQPLDAEVLQFEALVLVNAQVAFHLGSARASRHDLDTGRTVNFLLMRLERGWCRRQEQRADERTRTALLLITSDNSGVAERCTVLRSWWCQKFVDYTSTGEEGKYCYRTQKDGHRTADKHPDARHRVDDAR